MQSSERLSGGDQSGSIVFLTCICLVAALGGLLFGYDTAVIAGAIGPLETYFGLSAAAKGWAAGSALVGCVFGAAFAGLASDRLGRKKVLIISAVFFLISAIGSAIPRSLAELVIFRILGGLGVGAASMTSPMYIAEVSPARIRGRMVSVNQLAIVSGIVVVYFVNYFIARGQPEEWINATGWRWMFGSEALPAMLLLVLLFFVPESPRWLTANGREDAALGILERVDGSAYARTEMVEIRKAIQEESSSLGQLLMPGMRIVLVIGIALSILQQITGINVFLYYAPEILKGLVEGTKTDVVLLQTVLVGAVNLIFTIIAIWTVDKLGRKPLMIVGATGMGISMFAIGLAAYFQNTAVWVLVFILGYISSFSLSVGPVTWVILSEIFPTKIRGRAMGIATLCLWIANYIVSQTFPMMDGNEWLVERFHHAFPFWLYGGFCVVLVFFVGVFVPETKGRSLEEIERMWARSGK